MRTRTVHTNGVDLVVAEDGPDGGPLVILAHGFPEGSYSWRHQLAPLAAAGYHVIAPDQRGYGHSSAPTVVDAYGIDQLCDDLLGLLDDSGQSQAVFVGHDWGALITWEMARLHPDRVRAVVGVSVPFVQWPAPPTQLFTMLYGDKFFYMSYFQQVGPAEAELGADPRRTMARVLWSASGDGFDPDVLRPDRPAAGTGFLDGMSDPPRPLPAWLTDADIDHYAEEFRHSGFFGPVSYYRNLDANYERVKDIPVSRLSMPSYFIGGSKDPVIAIDGSGLARMRAALPNYRGDTIIEGAGHWTQQEKANEFNDALLGFLATLG